MTIDRIAMMHAGSLNSACALIPILHGPNWSSFAGFDSANLLQSVFSGFSPLEKMVRELVVKPGKVFE